MKNIFMNRWLFILLSLIFSCSDNDDPAPQPEETGRLVQANTVGTWTAANLKLFAELAGQDVADLLVNDVEVLKVIYKTTYKDEEVNASGLVLLPKTTSAVPMISFHRGTTVEQSDAPSVQPLQSEQVISYSGLASTGFITAVPDMIGFVESSEILHPYYVEQPTADAVRDLLIAAREIAEEKEILFDERLFLAGYSQGGYITMAAHKALEAEPIDGFNVTASFPAAGGYDLNAMLEHLRVAPTYPDPYYLAFIGVSFQSYYEENDLVTSFFNEPYASRIPALFDGVNSGSEINSQLTEEIPALVREEILSNDDSYSANQFLAERFTENSPNDWTPVAPIFMYHGDADEVVPVQNSQATYERLLNNGANPDNLELIILSGHNHGSGVVPYVEDVMKKLQEMK